MKSKTSTYTVEFELITTFQDRYIINKKMKVAKSIYNACLNECLKRLKAVKADKEYHTLVKAESSKQRNIRLKEIERYYGYSEYDLHHWVNKIKYHFEGHLGINEVQKLATRAFKTVEKYHYGEAKKVFFKSFKDDISVENKSNKTGLRLKDLKIIWGNLSISFKVKKNDKYAQLALLDKTKYVRVLRREIRGKERFFVQLIQEGLPPKKHQISTVENRVGIDIGTSTVAVVSDNEVFMNELATIKTPYKKLRKLDRAMDRSRRSTNPQNYNDDGTVKKGRKTWIYSNHYKKLKTKHSELCRINAINRQLAINEDANHLRSLGDVFITEPKNAGKLMRRAKETTVNSKGKFNRKKRFGRSIKNRCPSGFQTAVEQKFKVSGGIYIEVSNDYRASQYDHTVDDYIKKKLSDRMYKLQDGTEVQRDWYSSFLLYCYDYRTQDIDKNKCISEFDKCYSKEKALIEWIKVNEIKVLNSGIKIA